MPVNLVTIDARRAFEIIALNKQGVKVETLDANPDTPESEYVDLVGQESLTRFDKKKKKAKKKPVKQKGDSAAAASEEKAPAADRPSSATQGSPQPKTEKGQPRQPKAPQQKDAERPRKPRPPRQKKPQGDAPAEQPQQPSSPAKTPSGE